jgi:hypothetical protein
MIRPVKAFLRIMAVSAVLVVPGFARAGETPNPALTACVAQYVQLGAAGFTAKYGAGDAGKRACLQANGGTTVQPVGQPGTSDLGNYIAAKLCTGESTDAGKRACIQAKLAQAKAILTSCTASAGGSKSAFEQCIKQALGVKTGGTTTTSSGSAEKAALTACATEAKALGYDAFQRKYGRGKDGLAACLRAHG